MTANDDISTGQLIKSGVNIGATNTVTTNVTNLKLNENDTLNTIINLERELQKKNNKIQQLENANNTITDKVEKLLMENFNFQKEASERLKDEVQAQIDSNNIIFSNNITSIISKKDNTIKRLEVELKEKSNIVVNFNETVKELETNKEKNKALFEKYEKINKENIILSSQVKNLNEQINENNNQNEVNSINNVLADKQIYYDNIIKKLEGQIEVQVLHIKDSEVKLKEAENIWLKLIEIEDKFNLSITERKLLEEENIKLSKNIKSNEMLINDFKNKIQQENEQKQQISKSNEELSKKLSEAEDKLKQSSKERRILEEDNSNLNKLIKNNEVLINKLKNKVEKAKDDITTKLKNTDKENYEEKITELENIIKKSQKEYNELHDENSKLSIKIKSNDLAISELKLRLQQEEDEKNARINLLKELDMQNNKLKKEISKKNLKIKSISDSEDLLKASKISPNIIKKNNILNLQYSKENILDINKIANLQNVQSIDISSSGLQSFKKEDTSRKLNLKNSSLFNNNNINNDFQNELHISYNDPHSENENSIINDLNARDIFNKKDINSLNMFSYEIFSELKNSDPILCITNTIIDNQNIIICGTKNNKIKVWYLNTYKLLYELTGHESSVLCLTTLSTKKHILVSGSFDKQIIIWNLNHEGSVHTTLAGHDGAVTCLTSIYSNSINLLISGSIDNTLIIWNLENYTMVNIIKENEWISTLTNFDFRSINVFAYGTSEGTIKIRSLYGLFDDESSSNKVNEELDEIILSQHNNVVTSLEYIEFRNTAYLISSSFDKQIKIWNLHNKTLIKNLIGHQKYIYSLKCFIEFDKLIIISGGLDKDIIFWDFDSEKIINKIRCHDKIVTSLSVCKIDNKVLICSGSLDQKILIWK